VLLLAVQHLKKLLLSLSRGCCALQIKTQHISNKNNNEFKLASVNENGKK
jgi:hypothetical protein